MIEKDNLPSPPRKGLAAQCTEDGQGVEIPRRNDELSRQVDLAGIDSALAADGNSGDVALVVHGIELRSQVGQTPCANRQTVLAILADVAVAHRHEPTGCQDAVPVDRDGGVEVSRPQPALDELRDW